MRPSTISHQTKLTASGLVRYLRAHSERLNLAGARTRVARLRATVPPLVIELADPRGRCNRQAFLNIALTFMALQTLMAAVLWLADVHLSAAAGMLANGPILWLGTTVCIKRLHDVGRRGWWMPGAFAVWVTGAMIVAVVVSMIAGAEAVAVGQPAFFALFAAITLPAFLALMWLHMAPSVATANAFGPVTGAYGLSMPTRGARWSQLVYAGGLVA